MRAVLTWRPSRRGGTHWLAPVLGALLVLNLIDGVSTLLVVRAGIAREANPVMATFLGHGPVAFMAAKIALVSLGATVLWTLRGWALAAVGGITALVTYAFIGVYQLHSLGHLIARLG